MAVIDQEPGVRLAPQAIRVDGVESATGMQGSAANQSFTGDPVGFVEVGKAQMKLPHAKSGTQRSPERLPIQPSPETRASLRINLSAARSAGTEMVEAAMAKDMPALAIAADNLDQALGRLWQLRSARDIDWQTILNHTQGMMRQFFTQKKIEELSLEQCQKISAIVDDYLGPATKSVDDLNEVLRLIEDAGFDPYAAISGDD